MDNEYEVDPNKDCGTKRCIYNCESCPFDIPEHIEYDPEKIEC